MGLGGLSLLVSLVMLKEQVGTNAQDFSYRTPAAFSDGLLAKGNLTCDDQVQSRQLCPNNWTFVPDSDGYGCLRLVESYVPFDTAQLSCGNMSGRLVTIPSAKRQLAIAIFLSSKTSLESWIGLRRYYTYPYYDLSYYWQGTSPNTMNYSNTNDYYLASRYCCGNDCAYISYNGQWSTASCFYNKQYLCEQNTICPDGVTGDNCDKVCHCYGEPCKGREPCKYGCEPGWTGPYCCTRTKKAEISYYCVNSTSDGRYLLILMKPNGRPYEVVQLLDESGKVLPWCSNADMSYDIDGNYYIKIRITAGNETSAGYNCGGNKTGDNSYKWLLALQEKKGVVLPFDSRVELSCDFNTADSMVGTQTQSLAIDSNQTSNIPSVEKPVKTREIVTLAVTDPYTGVALTQARLGDNMQLRMTLALSSGLTARGVSPYSCSASTADGFYNLALTDSDGCPAQGSSVISEFKGSNGTVKSGPFRCFAFPDYNDLSITCLYEFCFTEDNPRCNDRCGAFRRARLYSTTTSPRTSYPTETYYWWMTTRPWYTYRRKREATTPAETVSTSLHIITEHDTKDTGKTPSMATTTTVGPVAWASLLVVVVVHVTDI